MKFFASVVLVLPAFLICHISVAQDTLYWSRVEKLDWNDFKAAPDTTAGYEALTFSGIKCQYQFTDTSLTYDVAAFFLPKKSWKMSWADGNALAHEQLHFDISEIYARKLKMMLSALKTKKERVKKDVGELVQKIANEKEAMQDLYDEETYFGRKMDAQQEWERKISEALNQEF